MSANALLFESQDRVAVVTLNRPETNNFIDLPLAATFDQVCRSISQDADLRVVLVTAAGDEVFSLGTDPSLRQTAENRKELMTRLSLSSFLDRIEIPIIAAVNGDAVGQGLELILACDFRFGSDKAQFGMPQIKAGEIPWDGGTQRLPRIVGQGKAMEMILLGETIDADEALRIGLINKVVPHLELRDKALHLARSIADKGPVALRYVKEAINKGTDLSLEQGLRLEADLYYLLHTTNDRTEGIQAFQDKRPPRFKGK